MHRVQSIALHSKLYKIFLQTYYITYLLSLSIYIIKMDLLDNEIISGHRKTLSNDVKWLEIENIYQKFYRPNFYDIGGSYIEDVADLWFTCKTEIVGKIFLLHLFVSNRLEGYFNVSVSSEDDLTVKKKCHAVCLPSILKTYEFTNPPEFTCNYIKTYSFSDIDVEILKSKKLYIPVTLRSTQSNNSAIDKIIKAHDYRALLDDPVCSDFVIESVEGAKFNVHKHMLSANSEVFKAMLKENTAESQNSYMKMVDIEEEALKVLLEFIYSGTIKDLNNCNFINLLMLGDRYDLRGLKKLSEAGIMCELNSDNVFDILVLADLYNSEDLKLVALKYIKKYNVSLNEQTFDELKHVELVKDICRFLAS